jgi:hypothetical protein
MRQRAIMKFRPGLERFDEKRLLSAGPLTNPALSLTPGSRAAALHSADTALAAQSAPALPFIMSRITDPTPTNAILVPPFAQVLVQSTLPKPGAVYNVLSISVRNETFQTFNASSGFTVRLTNQSRAFPILTGTEQWKPNQVIVFYVLTKKYYPPNPVVAAGFQFSFASGVAIPGPSGIFLRLKYNPATFAKVLDFITVHGPGAKGHLLGLPDTALWEFLNVKTDVIPL